MTKEELLSSLTAGVSNPEAKAALANSGGLVAAINLSADLYSLQTAVPFTFMATFALAVLATGGNAQGLRVSVDDECGVEWLAVHHDNTYLGRVQVLSTRLLGGVQVSYGLELAPAALAALATLSATPASPASPVAADNAN